MVRVSCARYFWLTIGREAKRSESCGSLTIHGTEHAEVSDE